MAAVAVSKDSLESVREMFVTPVFFYVHFLFS